MLKKKVNTSNKEKRFVFVLSNGERIYVSSKERDEIFKNGPDFVFLFNDSLMINSDHIVYIIEDIAWKLAEEEYNKTADPEKRKAVLNKVAVISKKEQERFYSLIGE